MIKFACSNCGKSIRVDDKYAGKKGKCPKCGDAVVVPEQSTLIEFHCDSCGHKIKVPDRYAGKKGKCPKCKTPIVVPAAGEAPVPSETDDELYEEPATSPENSGGPDRRLIILMGGVAAVVVVGLIGLVIFLRSSGSKPAAAPVAAPQRRETAQTESRAQPVAADAPLAKRTVAPEASDAIRLQFSPSPGDKRTLRVATQLAMSIQEGQQQQVRYTQSFTVDLEAREPQADGTIPIRVTLAQIQVKTAIQGVTLAEYDSAKPQSEADSLAGTYVPFVGKRFTISVSDQGEIIDPGLDKLFLAVAVDRMEAEDDMMREQLKERAAEAIERTDQRFGSRQERTRALKKQLEEFPVFGKEEIRSLLDHLVAPLPAVPVQSNARWSGPIAVRAGTRLEMPGTYTLTAIEEKSCTIDARGERGADEEPFVYQTGNMTISNKLAGSSQVRLIVNRQTGWLHHKEQKTTLSGRVLRVQAAPQVKETTMQTDMEITTTVTPIE